jgi:hypothetical protein
MRIQCNPLPLLLLGLVLTSCIVEASKKKNHKKKGKKVKGRVNHLPPSTIFDDSTVVSHEVPVPTQQSEGGNHHDNGSISTPNLESSGQKASKVNIDAIHSSTSSSSLSSASESNAASDVIDALKEKGFENIKSNWTTWWNRNDLFDHVVMKSVEFIIGFIKQVEKAKGLTLAALFIKRFDEVDQVLNNVGYNDDNLVELTCYRPELATNHDKFFKVMRMINAPKDHEWAVKIGVEKLFDAKKHDSVIPLISALEKKTFNGRNLTGVAIQRAFYEGAEKGIKYFVEEFYDHPAVISGWYAAGLAGSWEHKSSTMFPFLLAQADQDDLEKSKNNNKYENDQEFRSAIDSAFSNAKPAGTRRERGSARHAMKILSNIQGLELLREKEIGGTIAAYLVGEPEETDGGSSRKWTDMN